jgi:hypothetical protein
MATYLTTTTYPNGDVRTFETMDGVRAMKEAAKCSQTSAWDEEENVKKTVTLTKDGDTIFNEIVQPVKLDKNGNPMPSK